MKKCDVCNKPFKNAHGVSTHKTRTPACGGTAMSWGAGAKKPAIREAKEGSGKEAIREILKDHPQGLPTAEIRAVLESQGFHLNANYISQVAAVDPRIIRVKRGLYRLKANVTQRAGASVVKEAVKEIQSGLTLPREALLLRIETLETQNRALHDAHLSLMRGIFV